MGARSSAAVKRPLVRVGRVSRNIQEALDHLRAADPVMAKLIDRVGPFKIKLERDRFRALVRSIIAQQISGEAAKSIYQRFLGVLGPEGLAPGSLARCSVETLRGAGISPQKAAYLLDLATRVNDGQVCLEGMERLSDETIISQLIEVKGIGVWTAQMFLIFSMGRWDVFPHGDFGVRTALRTLYGLPDLPDRQAGYAIAAAWRPYATVASWYCWRSLDLAPQPAVVDRR